MLNEIEYLKEAVKPDTRAPDPTRISVTQLSDSPLIRTLWLENYDKIEQEPEDMLWALYGTALDTIVKRHNKTGMVDLKLELPFENYTIVGKPDIFYPSTGLLVDVKTTSVWTLKNPRKEWTYQLNCYKYLMERLMPELKVEKLQIHGIARDWRKNEKLRYHDYPSSAFVIIDIPIWEDMEKVIDADIKRHTKFPREECTDEEKWTKPTTFALKKEGRKTAIKVENTKEQLMSYCQKNNIVIDGNHYIEERPGECVRCLNYCQVSSFCKYCPKKEK